MARTAYIMLTALVPAVASLTLLAAGDPPTAGYPISPVSFTRVQVDDQFWSGKLEASRTVTIPSSFRKCEETGRIDNFAIAAGLKDGAFQSSYPFDDSDVYKIMEGAAYTLASHPDPELERYLDALISKIAGAQEEDGYLMTWRTIDPDRPPTEWSGKKRWANTRDGHELYNAGHMYEAAVAHFQATGKRNFLDIALKNADLMVNTFGPGKLVLPPGHEEIEIGLVKLHQITGKKEYLELAGFFIEQRGNSEGHALYGETYQDHLPVTQQSEPVGHAVRAAYLYSAMADVAALAGKGSYLDALRKIWENLVNKKLYIIGGIGSVRGSEAFGDNYSLPNDSAYNETCAAIANILWNHRMFMLTGDGGYVDILERSLYNNLLAGVSLQGDTFFYPNVLEFDGREPFNKGVAGRSEWFNCSCCPANVSRFIPSLPGYVYSQTGDELYVNLYIGNKGEILMGGRTILLSTETGYPWDGKVTIRIDPDKPASFALKLRIPGWATEQPVPGNLYRFADRSAVRWKASLNGRPLPDETRNGYLEIARTWTKGDQVVLDLPMPVRLVHAHDKVSENLGKVAVQRGPIVYCAEALDNREDIFSLGISATDSFSEKYEENLLGGITSLHVNRDSAPLTLIPYFSWANREVGAMKVWFPLE